MLFTLRESWKTSDPVFSRDRGNLTYYSFTLDAMALKPSSFCNVRVVSANRIDRLARTLPLTDSRSRPRALPRHRRREASHIPPLPRLCPKNCVSSERLCLYRSSGYRHSVTVVTAPASRAMPSNGCQRFFLSASVQPSRVTVVARVFLNAIGRAAIGIVIPFKIGLGAVPARID